MKQPKRITVIGAGFMGCVIATIYAKHGYTVVLHDAIPAALTSFSERALPIAHGVATPTDSAQSIVGRVKLVADLNQALAGAELVHEVVQEDLPLKQALFAQLDRLCAPDVVLATNTSVPIIDGAWLTGDRYPLHHTGAHRACGRGDHCDLHAAGVGDLGARLHRRHRPCGRGLP